MPFSRSSWREPDPALIAGDVPKLREFATTVGYPHATLLGIGQVVVVGTDQHFRELASECSSHDIELFFHGRAGAQLTDQYVASV